MQTFITDHNLAISARNLDNKRLGKQRVEALQILDCLIRKPNRWLNHPATQMWKGNEGYLLLVYIQKIFYEWSDIRKFKNHKCLHWSFELFDYMMKVNHQFSVSCNKPDWVTDKFIEAHRSNLIRKNPDHYKPLFPVTKEGLDYIWPGKLEATK